MPITISLCVIARNEADFIGQCIKSASPYIDQAVVVDTGSTDKTPDIARQLGAEVWEFPWNNDFSAARNFALQKARGEWVLVMDCDEEVEHNTGEQLLSAVQSQQYDAYFINITNLLGEGKSLTAQSIRLFRNLPQFRYEGKVHEQISNSILQHSSRDRIGRSPFTLLHHGYNPDKVNIRAKIVRNTRLLEVQQGHTGLRDGFLMYNLGVEFVRRGQFQQALEQFIASLKITDVTSGYAPSLVNKTVVCLIELGRYRDALEQLAYFQSVFPDYGDLYLLEAACHLRCGRYSLAAASMARARGVTSNNPNYPVEGTIFGRTPDALLAEMGNLLARGQKQFRLSACILANNEEQNIARCIRSIGELADEVLLITTGSTDNTLPIAYEMGANLMRLDWQDSFARLRNFALERATGDWILFLNGDEEINQDDIPVLIAGLNTSTSMAHLVRLRTLFDVSNPGLFRDQAICKIIRNDKDLHYRSRLIEDVDHSVREKYGDAAITCLPVTVFDYGPVLKPHLQSAIFKRNVSLIAGDIRALGKNSSLYQALGHEFYKMKKYGAALACFKRALSTSSDMIPAEVWCQAVDCLFNLQRFSEGLELAKKAVALHPDYPDLIYLQGRCHLALEQLETAKGCFYQCLQRGDADWRKYAGQSGVGSHLAHCGLAEAFRRQGNLTNCLKHYRIAVMYPAGIPHALPPLVSLIIEQHGAGQVLDYLVDNGLDSCQYLSSAANCVHRNGYLLESLKLWRAAVNKLNQSNDPTQYQLIASSMFRMLGDVYHEAIKLHPDALPLKNVASFFN